MSKKIKLYTPKTEMLVKMLKEFQPVNDIILYVNNNAEELLLELPHIDYELKYAYSENYRAYREEVLNEAWEYTFFPYFYDYKLKKFYKNIIIRLHHYSKTYEDIESTFEIISYHWYTVYYSTYDAVCLYKKDNEIYAVPAEFVVLSEFNDLNLEEESLNRALKKSKRFIVAFEWDSDKFSGEEYFNGPYGILLEYEKKTIQDIEKYKKNFYKKTTESGLKESNGYIYYREIGYSEELLEEYYKKIEKQEKEKKEGQEEKYWIESVYDKKKIQEERREKRRILDRR